jgi:hypothetical protein
MMDREVLCYQLREIVRAYQKAQRLREKLWMARKEMEEIGRRVYREYTDDSGISIVPEDVVIEVDGQGYQLLFDVESEELATIRKIDVVETPTPDGGS